MIGGMHRILRLKPTCGCTFSSVSTQVSTSLIRKGQDGLKGHRSLNVFVPLRRIPSVTLRTHVTSIPSPNDAENNSGPDYDSNFRQTLITSTDEGDNTNGSDYDNIYDSSDDFANKVDNSGQDHDHFQERSYKNDFSFMLPFQQNLEAAVHLPVGSLSKRNITDLFNDMRDVHKIMNDSNQSTLPSKRKEHVAIWMESALFRLMDEHIQGGNSSAKPTPDIYIMSFRSWADAVHSPIAGPRSQAIFDRIGEFYSGDMEMQPDTEIFNLMLRSWYNVASSSVHGTKIDSLPASAKRAQDILNLMTDMHKHGNMYVKPNPESYIAVLETCQKAQEQISSMLNPPRRNVKTHQGRNNRGNNRNDNTVRLPRGVLDLIKGRSWDCARVADKELTNILENKQLLDEFASMASSSTESKTLQDCIKMTMVTWSKANAHRVDEKYEKAKKVEELLSTMEEHGITPDISHFSLAINTWGSLQDAIKRNDRRFRGTLPLEKNEAGLKAYEIFQRMEKKYNITADARMTKSIFFIMTNFPSPGKKELQIAEDLLGRLERSSDESDRPDMRAYMDMIGMIGSSQLPDTPFRIGELLERIEHRHQSEGRSSQVAVDAQASSYALNALAKCKQPGTFEQSMSILQNLIEKYRSRKHRKFKPDNSIFTSAIRICKNEDRARAGRKSQQILQLAADLAKIYPIDPPDSWMYNSVIECIAESGAEDAPEEALKIFDLLNSDDGPVGFKGRKLAPDQRTYTSVMKAYSRRGSVEDARQAHRLLDHMYAKFKAGSKTCKPDAVSCTMVLSAYAKCGDIDSIRRLLDHMKDLSTTQPQFKNLLQNQKMVHSCLVAVVSTASGNPNAVDIAEDLIKLMEEYDNINNHTDCYNICLEVYSRSKAPDRASRAENLLRRMHEMYMNKGCRDAKPNVKTYTYVIRCCDSLNYSGYANTPDETLVNLAIKTMNECCESTVALGDLRPNAKLYEAFFRCLASHYGNNIEDKSKLRIAKDMFRRCCNEGFVSEPVLSVVKQFNDDIILLEAAPSGASISSVRECPAEWIRNKNR